MVKILLIEHEKHCLDMLLKELTARDCQVVIAKTICKGIQQARRHSPDIILCNLETLEIDDFNTLKTLRQELKTAIIPIILFSVEASKEELRRCLALGADGYLIKPFVVEELVQAIVICQEKQTALRQWYAQKHQQNPIHIVKEDTIETARSSVQAFDSLNASTASQLQNVFDFIDANYHQPITLNTVAQIAGYSPAYLTSLVRRLTGQSLHRWIIERRMIAAQSLLLQTDQNISQIAELVGYQDAGHFSREFRRLYGVPPMIWRKQKILESQHEVNSQFLGFTYTLLDQLIDNFVPEQGYPSLVQLPVSQQVTSKVDR